MAQSSTVSILARVINWKVLPPSCKAAQQGYVMPGNAWVPTRVKIFGKMVWKIKLQLFTQYYQASLLQSYSLYFGNRSEQWRSFAVEPRSVFWAKTWCSSMFLSHNTTDWACCMPKLLPWVAATPAFKNKLTRKAWWQKFLKLCYSPPQSSAEIKCVELFLC